MNHIPKYRIPVRVSLGHDDSVLGVVFIRQEQRILDMHTPKTNGKAERFIQTCLREWAYAQAYTHSDERTAEASTGCPAIARVC